MEDNKFSVKAHVHALIPNPISISIFIFVDTEAHFQYGICDSKTCIPKLKRYYCCRRQAESANMNKGCTTFKYVLLYMEDIAQSMQYLPHGQGGKNKQKTQTYYY